MRQYNEQRPARVQALLREEQQCAAARAIQRHARGARARREFAGTLLDSLEALDLEESEFEAAAAATIQARVRGHRARRDFDDQLQQGLEARVLTTRGTSAGLVIFRTPHNINLKPGYVETRMYLKHTSARRIIMFWFSKSNLFLNS